MTLRMPGTTRSSSPTYLYLLATDLALDLAKGVPRFHTAVHNRLSTHHYHSVWSQLTLWMPVDLTVSSVSVKRVEPESLAMPGFLGA